MLCDSKFDYRGRVQFEGTVNDNTKAVVRLAAEKEFGAEGAPKAELDRVYAQHNFGKYATVTAGRQDLVVGNGLAGGMMHLKVQWQQLVKIN